MHHRCDNWLWRIPHGRSSSVRYALLTLISVRLCPALLTLLVTFSVASAQTFRIVLRDKGPDSFHPGSQLYRSTVALLSSRALERRAKVLPPDSLVMYSDAPIYPPYLADIEQTGARVLLKIRWRNYVVVACDSATAERLRTKPYVRAIQPTSAVMRPQMTVTEIPPTLRAEEYRYGNAAVQLRMLNIPEFHRIGLNGDNVLIGIIDTGFRWRSHQALSSTTVVAEYDFINGDTLTANEANDHPNQDNHGTVVMSVIAGWYPDSLIGVVPCAQYILAKTENIASERRIEEDAYAAALEWMEAWGVDVVNTSLGYSLFDSTETQYPDGSLDGTTTIVANAVLEATRRGVVCVVAAGNDGDAPGTISSPGDVESAITVGAVADTLLTIPRFTSRGPTADGRLKPDVAALGVNVRSTSNASPTAFGYGSGTSLATPLIAGSAALLLQAFPELRPEQIKSLLQLHASHHSVPNTAIGYGVPDVLASALAWNILCSPPIVLPRGDSTVVALAARSNTAIQSVEMLDDRGSSRRLIAAPPFYWTQIPASIDTARVAFVVFDEYRSRRVPPSGYRALSLRDTTLPCRYHPEQITLATVGKHTDKRTEQPLALPVEAPMITIPPDLHPTYARVYDVTGRLRATIPLAGSATTVLLPRLEGGVYFVVFSGTHSHVSRLVLLY